VSSGALEMADMIRTLQELSGFGLKSASKATREVEVVTRRQVARGLGPDGKPWKPTQAGTPPLKNAGAALTIKLKGKCIIWTLTGVEARHHLGAVRGKVKRPIIPIDVLPGPVVEAITKSYNSEFARITSAK